jgi:pyruvate formate lyase activating enzyme
VWLEVTTLLIPGENDSDAEIGALSAWFAAELGRDVPLHFTAFHPDYKMTDLAPTPASTLSRARRIARAEGLRYVYTGNVRDRDGGTTFCPACAKPLIVRDWYEILDYNLTPEGRCAHCDAAVGGRYGTFDHQFGRRRIPVRVAAVASH